jgi:hypothetical protein
VTCNGERVSECRLQVDVEISGKISGEKRFEVVERVIGEGRGSVLEFGC